LDTAYWTGLNHFVIWGSIVFYFAFTFAFYMPVFEYAYQGVARNLMSTAVFWFTMLLTVTILLVPVVAERFYYIDTRPTLTDKVRLKQKILKSKSKSGELILRRASTVRRSTRSLNRSGYAFAHSEGFGSLITSGAYMRRVTDPNDKKAAKNRKKRGSTGSDSGSVTYAPNGKQRRGSRGSRGSAGSDGVPAQRSVPKVPSNQSQTISHVNSNNNSSQPQRGKRQLEHCNSIEELGAHEMPNVLVQRGAQNSVTLRPNGKQIESTEL
jgi:ribosome assembly protein YihI (activator of Der GTPase)